MGHLNYSDLKKSLPRDLKNPDEEIESCCLAKTTKTAWPKQSENEASKAREIILNHAVGPITPSSADACRYFVTFIDENSSHACLKFL